MEHQNHRIRIEIEVKANNRRLFLGENGGPLRLCSRRIEKGGPGKCYINMVFVKSSSVASIIYTVWKLSGSIMDIHSEGRWFKSA